MFENIIGQERVTKELEKALKTNTLPGAILFSGEHYSGKVSTALELARSLSCKGDKSWNCSCKNCESHRNMLYPYLQIIGPGNFIDEINICADIVKNGQPVYARYMFIRSVRKLLKRFDPVLWEGTENKYKQVASNAVKAEELLREISVNSDDIQDSVKFVKKVDKIVSECSKVADSIANDKIPIDQIRKISSWAHSATDSVKIIIIENADAMGESSRNSLLKILEEPPSSCYFILTTSRKGAIIPTILSRVRIFNFPERTQADSAEVINRIFREDSGSFRSIREYFLGRKTDYETIKKLSEVFVSAIKENSKSGKILNIDMIADFKPVYSSKTDFVMFIENCMESFRDDV
ncbi:MAG: hypothetical protein PQJ46_07510, partial [Spirochaetales bacterium]|nr:hypothetical protein [Spirochaetales bacterium]